jgi:hypothetical protein
MAERCEQLLTIILVAGVSPLVACSPADEADFDSGAMEAANDRARFARAAMVGGKLAVGEVASVRELPDGYLIDDEVTSTVYQLPRGVEVTVTVLEGDEGVPEELTLRHPLGDTCGHDIADPNEGMCAEFLYQLRESPRPGQRMLVSSAPMNGRHAGYHALLAGRGVGASAVPARVLARARAMLAGVAGGP